MTPFAPLVQSQFQQGFSFIQQAMLVEQTMGNLPAAAQNYDQAIGMISSALGLAAQSGLPIQDNVFFCLACCHFHAARVKAAAGYPQFAPMHLAQAQSGWNA